MKIVRTVGDGSITEAKTFIGRSDGGEFTMTGFRDIKTLQKFASAHASIHNHFNQDRHLNRRDTFKQNRSAALAERRVSWPHENAVAPHFGDWFALN